MRFMCIGDPHFRCTNPEMRIDNYKEDIFNCLYESFEVAEKNKCSKVIILGDMFDNAEPVGIIRNEVIDLFQKKKDGSAWDLEFYTLVGNHDIIGHNLSTLKRTALGTIARCGVQIVDRICEEDICIYFGHYSDGIEKQDHSWCDADVYVMHANILPTEFVSDDYILIDNFKVSPQTRVVISGHYHPGYDTYSRQDGVVFCNPGAIARKSAIKSNIERDLQVLMVDITKDNCKIKYHKLKTAQSGDKIFNMEAAMDNKQRRKDKKDLSNKLSDIRNNNQIELSESPVTDFKNFSKKNGVSQEAINVVVNILSEIGLNIKQ